jgi:hypothetical protein
MNEFLITASPKVCGGEILGWCNGPFQGFIWRLSDPSLDTALIISLDNGQRKSELEGEEKLTFSASWTCSAWAGSSIENPEHAAAAMNSSAQSFDLRAISFTSCRSATSREAVEISSSGDDDAIDSSSSDPCA